MGDIRTLLERGYADATPAPDGFERLVRRRDRRRRNQRITAGVVGIAVFATVVAVLATREAVHKSPTPATEGAAAPDAVIDVAGRPSGIEEAGGYLWVSTYEGLVYRIDPATDQIVDTIDTGSHLCGDVVAQGDSILVSGCQQFPPTAAIRIETATGTVSGRWVDGFNSPVFGGGRAWAFDGGSDREVREVDPETGRGIRPLDVRYTRALGYGFDSLWVAGKAEIVRVDPDTGAAVHSYPLPPGMRAATIHGKIGGFATAGGYVWLTAYRGDPYGPHVTKANLFRINPSNDEIQQMLTIALDPSMSVRFWDDPDTVGP